MGCDIHCYIEHKADGWSMWSPFGGRINPGRNYRLFAKMAGVRNYGEGVSFVEPRGVPPDCAWESLSDNTLYISESGGTGCCSKEDAERWVANGSSAYTDERQVAVTHPDWHSHSWLTSDEFAQAVEGVGGCEYMAVLAAMRTLESAGRKTRIVFWFDN